MRTQPTIARSTDFFLKLPVVSPSYKDFTKLLTLRVKVQGVCLRKLASRMGASSDVDLLNFICADRRNAPYPADWMADNTPILFLLMQFCRIRTERRFRQKFCVLNSCGSEMSLLRSRYREDSPRIPPRCEGSG